MPGHTAAARVALSLIAVGSMTSVAHRAHAQVSPRLSFAVASIKVDTSGSGLVRLSTLPGRISAVNVTLRMLIRNAYNIPDSRMSGGPPWIGVDRFDVEARSDGSEPASQLRAMLRSLLEDRFRLNARIETRDLPVYSLIVARSDGKLSNQLRWSGDACLPPAPPAGAPPPPPPPPGGLGPTSGQCPSILAPGSISGRQLTMARLAETLSLWVDRTVIDRTGLEGNFDVDLQWMADRPLSGGPGDFGRGGPPPSSDLPSLFTALQEQLGLKLNPQRGPVEVLQIDRVEKPAED